MEGYIKVYRSMLDNPVVCKDSEYFAVWCYLLLNATHKEQSVLFKGEKIILKPGQLITGRIKIAEHFKISESKVQRILKSFESEQQIEQQISNKNRLITILKWNSYQCGEQQTEQQVNNNRTTTEQQANNNWTTDEQQLNTNKNDKNDKNDKNVKNEKNGRSIVHNTSLKAEADALFDRLWPLFPNKKGKGQVSSAAKQRLLKVGFEQMARAIDRYISELEKDSEWRRSQNGSTFFTSGYVDYLDDNFVPQEAAKTGVKKNSFNNIPQHEYDFEQLEKQLLQRRQA